MTYRPPLLPPSCLEGFEILKPVRGFDLPQQAGVCKHHRSERHEKKLDLSVPIEFREHRPLYQRDLCNLSLRSLPRTLVCLYLSSRVRDSRFEHVLYSRTSSREGTLGYWKFTSCGGVMFNFTLQKLLEQDDQDGSWIVSLLW